MEGIIWLLNEHIQYFLFLPQLSCYWLKSSLHFSCCIIYSFTCWFLQFLNCHNQKTSGRTQYNSNYTIFGKYYLKCPQWTTTTTTITITKYHQLHIHRERERHKRTIWKNDKILGFADWSWMLIEKQLCNYTNCDWALGMKAKGLHQYLAIYPLNLSDLNTLLLHITTLLGTAYNLGLG